MRKLKKKDYKNFKLLVNQFKKTNFSKKYFKRYLNKNYVVVIKLDNKLIGAGTIIFEQKLIHNYGTVAHIEDIIIYEEYRGKGYGSLLLKYLVNISIKKKCYKTILNCSEKIENFYKKNGFIKNGIEMALYLK